MICGGGDAKKGAHRLYGGFRHAPASPEELSPVAPNGRLPFRFCRDSIQGGHLFRAWQHKDEDDVGGGVVNAFCVGHMRFFVAQTIAFSRSEVAHDRGRH